MDELAYSLAGENAHYGTPANPAAPGRIPGGSSSGTAAAVAAGDADIGLGAPAWAAGGRAAVAGLSALARAGHHCYPAGRRGAMLCWQPVVGLFPITRGSWSPSPWLQVATRAAACASPPATAASWASAPPTAASPWQAQCRWRSALTPQARCRVRWIAFRAPRAAHQGSVCVTQHVG